VLVQGVRGLTKVDWAGLEQGSAHIH